jgi:hypothetical protein
VFIVLKFTVKELTLMLEGTLIAPAGPTLLPTTTNIAATEAAARISRERPGPLFPRCVVILSSSKKPANRFSSSARQ